MTDCIFCKIVSGEIESKKVYEDENVFAFYDLSPQAPVHILFIPKKHISHIDDITEDDSKIIGKIYLAITKVAKDLELDEKGYRVVLNNKEDGGQSVNHIHFHLLGGRSFNWPPG